MQNDRKFKISLIPGAGSSNKRYPNAELNKLAGTRRIKKLYERKWKYFGGFTRVNEVNFEMEQPPAV